MVMVAEPTLERISYKVYEYGITKITAGFDPARAQMRARADYWNELVNVERSYRDALDGVINAASPELAALDQQIGFHQTALGAAESGTDEEQARLKALLKPLYAEQKRLRKETITSCKPELAEVDAQRKVHHREARQRAAKGEPIAIKRGAETKVFERAPLYWGNYMDIDAAYNTARHRFGRQLKYHSGVLEDMVSIQATNGLAVDAIWGQDGRVQIDPVNPLAWTSEKRGERRKRSRAKGRLRVGSDGKNPRWLEFEFIMHRPLPENGIVRRVSVVMRRIGTLRQNRLLVTVETPSVTCRPEASPYMGIDIGWRRMGRDLRVAMVVGPKDEPARPFMLPGEYIAAMAKSEEIHSGRELDFNRARAALHSWIGEPPPPLPDWFLEAVKYMGQWKAPGKLARLYWQWQKNRFVGDIEAFNAIEKWFKQDRHLWDWEANARDQAIARRKHIFRQWALELANLANKHKATIAIEKFDLRGVIGADELDIAAHMRSLAGVGILRETIKHTAAREGVPIKEVPSKNTTRLCNYCLRRGRENLVIFDAASELNARCDKGHIWDQDANAAKNLILLADKT